MGEHQVIRCYLSPGLAAGEALATVETLHDSRPVVIMDAAAYDALATPPAPRLCCDICGKHGVADVHTCTPRADVLPGWYVVSASGLATKCVDEDDARKAAADCNVLWLKHAPHRVVRLSVVEEAQTARDAREGEG